MFSKIDLIDVLLNCAHLKYWVKEILMLFNIFEHLQLRFVDVILRRIAYTHWKRNVKWFERTAKQIIILE